MNVVMSSATAIAHERAGNAEQAVSSRRTASRATILLNALWDKLPTLQRSFAALEGAVAAELGEEVIFVSEDVQPAEDETNLVLPSEQEQAVDQWTSFLERWKYDKEQLVAVSAAMELCGTVDES